MFTEPGQHKNIIVDFFSISITNKSIVYIICLINPLYNSLFCNKNRGVFLSSQVGNIFQYRLDPLNRILTF